jgi:hypothetical protein
MNWKALGKAIGATLVTFIVIAGSIALFVFFVNNYFIAFVITLWIGFGLLTFLCVVASFYKYFGK